MIQPPKALCGAAALSLGLLWGCSSHNVVSADAVQKYQSAGMAWSRADIEKSVAVKPEDNAGPLLEKAYAAWGKAKKGPEPVLSPYPLKASEAGDVLARLEPFAGSLELAQKASMLKAYDPGWDPDVDYGMVVPELLSLRSLVRGLCLRSEARIVAGQTQEGLNDWSAAVRLTLLARTLPDAFALVHSAGYSLTASRTAVKLAQAAGKEVSVINKLAEGLKLLNEEPDWRSMIRMDGYATLTVMRNAETEQDAQAKLWMVFKKDDPFRTKVVREGAPNSKELNKAFGEVLDFYTKVCSSVASPNSRLEDVISHARDLEVKSAGDENSLGSAFLSQSLSRIAAAMGHARAALAVISLKQLQLSSGSPPSSLAVLDKQISTDPLTGQPLGASFGGGRLKVWSVGADFVNDGGTSRIDYMSSSAQSRRSGIGFDETAELPHPTAPKPRSTGRFQIDMPRAVMNAPAPVPTVSTGSGIMHELPPARSGVGALSIRRDVGLGNAF